MASNTDIDSILESIREEVRRIKASGDQAGRTREADGKRRTERPLSKNGQVRAGRLLRFHGEEFVRKAYLALLNRQPDHEGLRHWIKLIREEGYGRAQVLGMISESAEGRVHNIPIHGLKRRVKSERLAAKLRDIPLLGRGFRNRDSAERGLEEIWGRLGRLEDRLERLERLVRGREDDPGPRN